MQVIVTVHGGDDFRVIHVDEFGQVNAPVQHQMAGDVQTTVELAPGESRWLHIPIMPIIDEGTVNIVFSAYSIVRIDREKVQLQVIVSLLLLFSKYRTT